jgi:hypothetical protein
MEELIKICQILDAYRLRQIDIIGNEDSESRYSEFFLLIKNGTIKTDTDAVRHFYDEKSTDRSFTYRQFKNTFRERLINTLFFIDVNHPSFDDFESISMTIQKEWAAINILFTKGELSLPTLLSEKLLPTAIKYELTEIVVYITDRLKNSYGGQLSNVKKYTYYKRLQKEHMAIWQAEIAAKDLYQELRMHYIKSTAHKPHVAKIAERGLKELEPALEKYKTIRLIYYAYIAKIGQFTAVNDFKAAIKICDEGIVEFKQKPYEAQRLINTFLNQKLICLIQLKEYDNGQVLVDEILALQIKGSLSWFKTLEYSIILAFHTKNYEEAYVLYNKAWNNDKIKTLTLRNLEIWYLYKAYLFFLISIGQIKSGTLKSEEFVDFKLNKFLNDVSIFGRDSEGMKISVLIIEIALNLVEEKFGKMIDTSEALTKYRQRHVAKSHFLYRHNIMIKMIGLIPRSGFTKSILKRITEVPLRAMKKVPMQTDGQSFQSEIIPLEDMWDFIVNTLKG